MNSIRQNTVSFQAENRINAEDISAPFLVEEITRQDPGSVCSTLDYNIKYYNFVGPSFEPIIFLSIVRMFMFMNINESKKFK